MLHLHVIQAKFGDSLLLQFGSETNPSYLLIDGGPNGVYQASLRAVLAQILGSEGTLDLLVVSHIDMDHIKGILDLLAELKSQKDNNQSYFLSIQQVWMNQFSQIIDTDGSFSQRLNEIVSLAGSQNVQMQSAGIALNGVKEGHQVTRFCKQLDIPINKSPLLVSGKSNTIKLGNLHITVTGPTQQNLDALQKEWEDWLEKQEEAISNGTFEFLAMSDRSVPNLSSLTFLVKSDNRTILFTGDGRGDHLIQGLREAGLLQNQTFHVDVLKVPHHGSKRNTDQTFFETILADTYVISADGKYGNPDYETLVWIVEAAQKNNRNIRLVLTNVTLSSNQLKQSHPPADWNYQLDFIPSGQHSIRI